LPISAESVLDAVDARDGRGYAWARAGSEPISTDGRDDHVGESIFASGPTGPTREPTPDNGSDGLPEGGLPCSVKPLLTSPSALLLLGTLGVGLLAVVFYRLLHRRGAAENKAPSVPRAVPRVLRR
jgi:hypothetical protein